MSAAHTFDPPEDRVRDHPDFQEAVTRLLLDARYLGDFDVVHRVGRTWKDTASDLHLVLGAPRIPDAPRVA